MKILHRTFFPLLFFILLTSCATTSAGDNHKEKKQNQKKLLFEDWKYKGFGQELPVWFESAFKDDVSEISKRVQELSGHEILIVRGEGINSDQADKVLKIKEKELSSDFIFFDSCWALPGEKYVAIALYYK